MNNIDHDPGTDKHGSFVRLVTARTTVRRFSTDDAQRLLEYRLDPHAAEMQGWPTTWSISDAIAFITDNLRGEPGVAGTWYQFAVADNSTDVLLGDIGLYTEHNQRHFRIGYTLHPDARGQGLLTEALDAFLRHLFDVHRALEVRADVLRSNRSSRALLERIGFEPTNETRDNPAEVEYRISATSTV
jgi:RimJ/RimL family protein N-acetyltransferase